jgi:HD superfamily phosphohydrolase
MNEDQRLMMTELNQREYQIVILAALLHDIVWMSFLLNFERE